MAGAGVRSEVTQQLLALAVNTFKEATRSKVFYILLAFAICLLGFSSALGFMAIGSIRRVVLDVGLATVSYFSAITAIFVGIGLIYREIEGKTIYNILSKPVTRSTFLLGRYLGLMAVLLVNLSAMTGALSLVLLAFGGFTPRVLAAAGYIYLELLIITAVALFFSSVASPVLSAICTVAFYLIGHTSSALTEILAPQVHEEWLRRVIIGLYHVLPDLNLLNIDDLVVHDIPEAAGFTVRAVLYTVLMVTILLTAASFAFRRRDLV